MINRKSKGRWIFLVAAALTVTALAVSVVVFSARRQEPKPYQAENLLINNKTQGFEVVSAVSDGEFIHLTLRNNYSQGINAFTLSASANSGVQVDLTHNDNRIEPGAIYHYRVLPDSLDSSASAIKPLTITILDVVFEDGTGDGDPTAIADIQNRRRGERIALARLVPLMAQALNSRGAETGEDIERLKEQISFAVENLTSEQQGEILGGILHGKGYLIAEIEEAQKHGKGVNLHEQLLKIQRRYIKKLERLQRVVE